MNETGGQYIHGSDPEEQHRLGLLNELLNESSLRALNLRGGERVLDLGSGLGQLARAIGRVVGEGHVVAIERDPEQLKTSLRLAREAGEEGLVDFRQGDAFDPPLSTAEWGGFDLAHTRFLLEHLPEPQQVVDSMVRAVHPGGRIVLEDDDHDLLRIWPEVPGFEGLWRAYLRTYDQLGNDPYIGRRLVEMLKRSGADPVQNDMLFFGSCSGDPAFRDFVRNFVGILEGAPDAIIEATTLELEELKSGIEALREWGQRDDAALWYVTCWAEGRRSERSEPTTNGEGKLSPDRALADSEIVRARSKLTSIDFLVQSAGDLNSSLRLDEVFKKIGERVRDLIDCHLFCIMLWNEKTQLLEHSYSLKFGEHIDQTGGFALGEGISGSAAAVRRPIRVPEVADDPRYVRFRHAEVNIRSELAVPLLVKDRLVGVLDLESLQPAAFTAENERIVVALASQIATALENARLYEELEANEIRLENDLDTARQLQAALLPTTPTRLADYEIGAVFEPARELSGDFYDFFRYQDGRLAVVLGDVAGKSTGAALYGSMAVGLLRGFALEHAAEPSEILKHLNAELNGLKVDRRFVAMSFGVLDAAGSKAVMGNAGVPQPLLVSQGSVRRLDTSGVPLGGLEDTRYSTVTAEIRPGDLLVMVSDGLDDCLDGEGERLGEAQLPNYLVENAGMSAQEIALGLVELSSRHSEDTEVADDRTVVIVKSLNR
jgi:serine phosphatase RsbU (regulator of sigma subunit)/SAM-dependent methyltransferase